MITYTINGRTTTRRGDTLQQVPWRRSPSENITHDLAVGPSHTVRFQTLWDFAKAGMVLPKSIRIPIGTKGDNAIIYGEVPGTKLKSVNITKKAPDLADVELLFVPVAYGEVGASDLNLTTRRCTWDFQPTLESRKRAFASLPMVTTVGTARITTWTVSEVSEIGIGGTGTYTTYTNKAGVSGASVSMPTYGVGGVATDTTGYSITDEGLVTTRHLTYVPASWRQVSVRALFTTSTDPAPFLAQYGS